MFFCLMTFFFFFFGQAINDADFALMCPPPGTGSDCVPVENLVPGGAQWPEKTLINKVCVSFPCDSLYQAGWSWKERQATYEAQDWVN